MTMEYDKFSQTREKLNSKDLVSFDNAYEKIKELFLEIIQNTFKRLASEDAKENDFSEYFKAAKVMNQLAENAGIRLDIPEKDEYLLKMYAIKYGSQILNK